MTLRLALDPASALPIYRQVADALRAAIGSGRLAPDTELPGLRDLAADLRVNYHTIARAYQELEDAGLLTRQRGGPFRVALGARELEALAQGLPPDAIRGWWGEAIDALEPQPDLRQELP